MPAELELVAASAAGRVEIEGAAVEEAGSGLAGAAELGGPGTAPAVEGRRELGEGRQGEAGNSRGNTGSSGGSARGNCWRCIGYTRGCSSTSAEPVVAEAVAVVAVAEEEE